MTKTDKRLLGKYNWYLKKENVSITGVDPCWRDPDATFNQLKEAAGADNMAMGEYFYLTQWEQVKDGRRTFCKQVEIARFWMDGTPSGMP